MGLLELCLLPLLSPQEPAATVPTPTATAPAPVTSAPAAAELPCADPVDVAALQRLERSEQLDFDLLDRLLAHENPAVQARAVWLLGQKPSGAALPRLQQLAQSSPLVEARVQAMAALLRAAPANALPVAMAGLDDEDARVRTLAAQLLGRLQAPEAERALLDLLRRPAAVTPAKDAIAALLALHDLKAQTLLLPAAEAVQDNGIPGLGQALAFYFQGMSPSLPERSETPLLLSVLAHREPMLRRYALGRLAQLAPADATAALEARLAQETAELRPLVEVALMRCRPPVAPVATPTTAAAEDMVQRLRQRWAALDATQQLLVYGLGGGFLLGSIGLLLALSRRRRNQAATPSSIADLVAPSAEHTEEEQLAAIADEVEELTEDLESAAGEVTTIELEDAEEAPLDEGDWSTEPTDASEAAAEDDAELAAETVGADEDYRN